MGVMVQQQSQPLMDDAFNTGSQMHVMHQSLTSSTPSHSIPSSRSKLSATAQPFSPVPAASPVDFMSAFSQSSSLPSALLSAMSDSAIDDEDDYEDMAEMINQQLLLDSDVSASFGE